MPKLYCIFAREAEQAVIFRRGPTGQVRLIGWNLATDSFEPGQWFKGRIYEQKSDLSPNGQKLLYFAAVHHGSLPSWVAISTPPYLTAHVLWPKYGTYDGLSLFETDTLLGLGVYGSDPSFLTPRPGDAVPPSLSIVARPYPGYFYRRADHDRLIRDGWRVESGEPKYTGKTSEAVVYRKRIDQHHDLDMHVDNPIILTETAYSTRLEDGSSFDLKADWADVRDGRLYFARAGRLLRLDAGGIGRGNKAEQTLADFTDMAFENVATPDWATRW